MKTLTNSVFLGPTIVLFGLFFILPMGMLVISSFSGADGFTLENYLQILVNPRYSRALFSSFVLSVVITAVTLVISGVVVAHSLPASSSPFPASRPRFTVSYQL